MLLEELGAALEDLGHCEEKKSRSTLHTQVNICAAFTETVTVKNVMTLLLKSEYKRGQAGAHRLSGQEAAGAERLRRVIDDIYSAI